MKRIKTPKIAIIMPGYNVAKTIKDTYKEIPKEFRKIIILVDDKSTDNTATVAKKLGIKVITHSHNRGYGAGQKTGYAAALKYKPDVVVMVHPDYQYDATKIFQLIKPIMQDRYDFMFGSRMSSGNALKGGMPRLKFVINKIVCFLENVLLGVHFTEHFSGFRAYSSQLLKTVPFEKFSDDFVFDQQMEIAAISYGFRIGEIAIPTRYHEKASSIHFLKGSKFLIDTFFYLILFKLHQTKLIQSNLFLQTT